MKKDQLRYIAVGGLLLLAILFGAAYLAA